MQAVTSEPGGTAYYIFGDFPYTAAAKTGTAETGAKNNSSNASFIAFSPVEKPKIAVAVVIERGVSGSNCAPVARDIFNEYFKLTADNTTEETIYKDEFSFTR